MEFVSSGPSGHHSVTFPSVLVGDDEVSPNNRLTFLAIHPACDFDDRAGGAPGIGGPWPFTPVPCQGSLEFVLSPYLAEPQRAPGDLVATPATYHDSGLMWSEEAPETARGRPAGSGEYFLHRFVAEFPSSGVFDYACTIHGADFMAGTVEVESGSERRSVRTSAGRLVHLDAAADRFGHELEPRAVPELGVDVNEMRLDGRGRDEETVGDEE